MCAQGFHQELRQKQTQQLVLAPQLRQSLKILQVAALDLRTTIQEELQNNPTLEELPMDSMSLEANSPPETESDKAENPKEELNFEENFEILNKLDDDWRDFMSEVAGNTPNFTPEDSEKRQFLFDSLVAETSLQEHLMRQADIIGLNEQELEAINYLIGSLDSNGFLTASHSDIALEAELPLQIIQDAHAILKTFEPPGIGCSDIQECLLEQLRIKGATKTTSYRIIKRHFKLLARRKIPEISKKLSVPMEEIQKAIEEIARLDPAPGRRFADDTNRSVAPDIIVERDGDKWVTSLNNDYIPRLRINSEYKELIAKGTLSQEEKEYLHEKMRSGKFLINSIDQRQQTIERIAREVVRVQTEFLEEGVSKLRPLTMTQVAETVGVHETTVSRAISSKYIQTPHGVFALKFFFTSGYQSSDGENISNTSVKDMISHLVQQEDPSSPLSDQEIVTQLQEKNIKIARRTVAKYRDELDILPSNLRKSYS